MMKQGQSFASLAAAFTAAATLSTLTAGGAVAQAQPAAQLESGISAPTSTVNIDETKLDKFVDAFVAVRDIQKEAMAKQSSTPDQDAAKALQAETQAKMSDAVEKSGLQIDEFNSIAQLMLQDTDLRARINAKLQQRLGG